MTFLRGTLFQGLSGFKRGHAPQHSGPFSIPHSATHFPSFPQTKSPQAASSPPLYGNSVTRGVVLGFGLAASPVSLITCVISPLSSSAIVIA